MALSKVLYRLNGMNNGFSPLWRRFSYQIYRENATPLSAITSCPDLAHLNNFERLLENRLQRHDPSLIVLFYLPSSAHHELGNMLSGTCLDRIFVVASSEYASLHGKRVQLYISKAIEELLYPRYLILPSETITHLAVRILGREHVMQFIDFGRMLRLHLLENCPPKYLDERFCMNMVNVACTDVIEYYRCTEETIMKFQWESKNEGALRQFAAQLWKMLDGRDHPQDLCHLHGWHQWAPFDLKRTAKWTAPKNQKDLFGYWALARNDNGRLVL